MGEQWVGTGQRLWSVGAAGVRTNGSDQSPNKDASMMMDNVTANLEMKLAVCRECPAVRNLSPKSGAANECDATC